MSKYFLRKNEKNIEANVKLGQEKLPYFTLFEIVDSKIEGGKSEFVEKMAFWKSKSGKGYSGTDSKPMKKVEKTVTQTD